MSIDLNGDYCDLDELGIAEDRKFGVLGVEPLLMAHEPKKIVGDWKTCKCRDCK